jgi:type I restriction enzyme R subunit
MSSDEEVKVEQPFLDQLDGLGWTVSVGDTDVPYLGERDSFRDVLFKDEVREAVRRINRHNGEPWLGEARVNKALYDLERVGAPNLMEANQTATRLLQKGTVVEGDPERHEGKNQTVRYLDFEHLERNRFHAISQFRVDGPGGEEATAIPDVVLFVNGIPLVVVECKNPSTTDPMVAATNDLLKYSNQRDWVDEREGAPPLFYYNQLMVATSYDKAIMGTVGARPEHYVAWKDTAPVPQEKVKAQLGTDRLSQQETLVAGALRPAHLLQIVRSFVLFDQSERRTKKLAARYQQFRAVHAVSKQLQTGETRAEDGTSDRRGGIIWHTQGSGKSLTMVFLVRLMRTLPALRRFKVVVVADRTDLIDQLSETAELTGETLRIAESIDELKRVLQEKGPGLVFATVQKYQETSQNAFPVLNESEDIVVLADEAHRSHSKTLHANLMRALPNCAKIGFTGTPILMGDKKRTHAIFGDYLDTYTIEQGVEDGVTVPIMYEGRMERAALKDGRTLDDLFEEAFSGKTAAEREEIKKKQATKRAILESKPLIQAKAEDMLRHYVAHVLPGEMKAQVVATSRRAAVRYQKALTEAIERLREELRDLPPQLTDCSPEEMEELEEHDPEAAFLAGAHAHWDAIRTLSAAAVISSDKQDPAGWDEWSNEAATRRHIDQFKKALPNPASDAKPSDESGLAFLCVCTKLLTGFDAPVEQVIYLDRKIKEHNLLQAIARVNRRYSGKRHGLVVDYYNVASHLDEALDIYSSEDVAGALTDIDEELPRLEQRYDRVMRFFTSQGVDDLWEDEEEAVALLAAPKERATFTVYLEEFTESLDIVMPRPEALEYKRYARQLGKIKKRAANRFRDETMDRMEVGAKVRELIDRHLVAEGIDPRVPPVSIMDAEFGEHIEDLASDRAKASEMEHAARHHIRKHREEDPARYDALSERLEDIIERYENDWDALVHQLDAFVERMQEGRTENPYGLDPKTEAPFHSLLVEECREARVTYDASGGGGGLPEEEQARLADVTQDVVEQVQEDVKQVDFWRNRAARKRLRARIAQQLDGAGVVPLERLEATTDRIMEVAKHRHLQLTNDA